MKRKFSMFLNIAMLCLCVCAIAFGVYSAKTASLNVSGTVGFTAHNCNVDVKVSILGDSVAEDGKTAAEFGTPRTQENVKEYTEEIAGANKSLALEKFYFCDMTENENPINPITITFTFTNKSDFMVNASVTSATADGVNIAKDKHAVVLMDQNADVANKTQEITFTLTLGSNTQSFAEAKSLNISIKLEKYNATTLAKLNNANNFFWNNNSTNTRSYVTMGQVSSTNTKALRWYIFAAGNSDSNMNAITTNLDNNGYLPKGTYWFISEYVLDSKKFQAANTSSKYQTSDIKAYLDGTGSGTSFAATYGITAQDAVYSQITARTLEDAADAENKVGALTKVENQKLWLLSVSELKYLNNGTPCDTKYKNNSATYSKIIAQNTSSTASFWWLRSPYGYVVNFAFLVADDGSVLSLTVGGSRGVRAAFQITI